MSTDIEHVIKNFKNYLKKNGILYADLSQKTGIPISTIKKNLSTGQLTLARLEELCIAAGVSFLDLMTLTVQNHNERSFFFDEVQEKLFFDDPIHYLVFNKLYREKYSLDATKKYFKLTEIEMKLILSNLQSIKLIRILPEMNIQFLVVGGIKIRPESQLAKMIFTKSLDGLIHYLTHAPNSQSPLSDPFLRLNFSLMTESCYNDLLQTLQDVYQNFGARSIRERRMYPVEKLMNVSWVFGVGKCNAVEAIARPLV